MGKYEENYPPDKFEYDPTKMTYTDTVYTITLTNPTVFYKKSNNKIISTKLDYTTLTTANLVLFGGNYTVADIAFSVLTEIIHDIPTFELLGVPFDKEGCGYCSYWQHLNKDFSNRQKFKVSVRNWYLKNKDNIVWVKSNNFATCDCSGRHPNGGHYKLKTDKRRRAIKKPESGSSN